MQQQTCLAFFQCLPSKLKIQHKTKSCCQPHSSSFSFSFSYSSRSGTVAPRELRGGNRCLWVSSCLDFTSNEKKCAKRSKAKSKLKLCVCASVFIYTAFQGSTRQSCQSDASSQQVVLVLAVVLPLKGATRFKLNFQLSSDVSTLRVKVAN